MSGEEDRLARWSRLKTEAAAPPAEPPRAPVEEEADDAFIAALPKIEEIDAATDIRGFLRKGVPQALRAAALTRAWMADPSIRDRIPEAIDYAEDYNAPQTISGWGEACPQEARSFVERTFEPVRERAKELVAQAPEEPPAQVEQPAADPAPEHAAVGEPSCEAHASPRQDVITKNRFRHGGALPCDS